MITKFNVGDEVRTPGFTGVVETIKVRCDDAGADIQYFVRGPRVNDWFSRVGWFDESELLSELVADFKEGNYEEGSLMDDMAKLMPDEDWMMRFGG